MKNEGGRDRSGRCGRGACRRPHGRTACTDSFARTVGHAPCRGARENPGTGPAIQHPLDDPSFRNQVIPVLTKMGCNSGACHGAAAGKNGFALTLRGYDPGADYETITRQAGGRRVNKLEPAKSLILLKPTETVPHMGGTAVPGRLAGLRDSRLAGSRRGCRRRAIPTRGWNASRSHPAIGRRRPANRWRSR